MEDEVRQIGSLQGEAASKFGGRRSDGCDTIGEEIVRQPPQPAFFNAGFGPTGTQTRKVVYNKSMRGAMRSCRARVNPEAR